MVIANDDCEKLINNAPSAVTAADEDYRPRRHVGRAAVQPPADGAWRQPAQHIDCDQPRYAPPIDDGYRPRKPAAQPSASVTQPAQPSAVNGGYNNYMYGGGYYGSNNRSDPSTTGAYPSNLPGNFPAPPAGRPGQYHPGLYAPNIVYPPAAPDYRGSSGATVWADIHDIFD